MSPAMFFSPCLFFIHPLIISNVFIIAKNLCFVKTTAKGRWFVVEWKYGNGGTA